jgi:hypothetical protein
VSICCAKRLTKLYWNIRSNIIQRCDSVKGKGEQGFSVVMCASLRSEHLEVSAGCTIKREAARWTRTEHFMTPGKNG